MVDNIDVVAPTAGADPVAAPAVAAAPVVAEAPKPAGTIVSPGAEPTDGKPVAIPADWPQDWRDKLAGEDKAFRKKLDRYTSPLDVGKAYRALETKLSGGEYRKGVPENATPEQMAEWRKEAGLPEKPEGYIEKLALPNGLVLGEADKPIVAELAKSALDGNVDPKAFNGLVAKYYEMQDAQAKARAEKDTAYHDTALAELSSEYGGEFKKTITGVNSLVEKYFPSEISADLLVARLPDGRLLGDNPQFIKALALLSKELDPGATLIPAGGGTVTDRLEEIRKLRRENPDKYEADHKLQAEELELIDADLKMKARGK